MAYRVFVDDCGITWQVWETIPSSAERRRLGERRRGSGALSGRQDRRRGGERRRFVERRVPVTAGYELGWLTFESADEKRRLTPVPPDWEGLSDGALADLCALAHTVQKRRGRFIE